MLAPVESSQQNDADSVTAMAQPQPPNVLSEALAAHLKAHKAKHGLSLRALATNLNVNAMYLRRLLAGEANVSLAIVVTIADALQVPPISLLVHPDHTGEK